jgi:hypothetical protein
MQSTDLEALAEQMIQEPDITSEDDNPSEAVEAQSEAPDEDQTEIDTDIAESDDEPVEAPSEVDDDDLDDEEIDADEPPEQAAEPVLYDVKIDGKMEKQTLEQLKQSASGQGYINRRMQEIAHAERQYKEQFQALQQQQQQTLALYNHAQNGLAPPAPPQIDFEQDPIGAMQEERAYNAAKAEYDEKLQQVQQIQRHQSEQQDAQSQQYIEAQVDILRERLPELVGPDSEAKRAALVQAGVDYYGFAPEEVAAVKDARHVQVLNDAKKWRELQTRKKERKATANAVPTVRAGAKRRPETAENSARKKARERFAKSGRLEDAVELLL